MRSYTNGGIIAVVMGIILSIISNSLSIAQKHKIYVIGEKLSIIGQGLTDAL